MDMWALTCPFYLPTPLLSGDGLLVSDGEVWQRQRRLSNPAFRRTAVEAYGAAMVGATLDMLDNTWRQGEPGLLLFMTYPWKLGSLARTRLVHVHVARKSRFRGSCRAGGCAVQ